MKNLNITLILILFFYIFNSYADTVYKPGDWKKASETVDLDKYGLDKNQVMQAIENKYMKKNFALNDDTHKMFEYFLKRFQDRPPKDDSIKKLTNQNNGSIDINYLLAVDTNATELDKPPKYEYKNLVFNYGQSKEADGGIKVNLKYKFKRSDNLKIKLVQFLGIKKYFIPNVSYIKISPVKGKNQIKMEVACTPKIKVYEKPFIEMVESFLKSGSESLKNYILPRI